MKKIILIISIVIIGVFSIKYFYFSHIQNKEEVVLIPEKLQIEIFSPAKGEKISNPITIKGRAKGPWFFEASFPIFVVDNKGNNLGQGIARALDDWMTVDFVNFEAEINFANPTYTKTGYIIFKRDNPSGLPENDFSYRYPINFK